MDKEIKIKECPKCGEKETVAIIPDSLGVHSDDSYSIGCCLCDLYITNRTKKKKMVEDWNSLPRENNNAKRL